MKKLKSAKQEPRRYEAYYEYLGDARTAEPEAKRKKAHSLRLMEKDNCDNWMPY
ncbi:hypothetical protein GGR58DRAFT_474170 [Xylaria digitata]|nr:hypothetical protein GGR58DRAFT_474170 [Xylaria digitata]